MDSKSFEKILRDVRAKRMSLEEAMARFRKLPFEDLGFAKVDSHRGVRCGFPEVIFCSGKSPAQVERIVQSIAESGGDVLATRADAATFERVSRRFPRAEYNELARTIVLRACKPCKPKGLVLIVSAGTSDIPIAEEARVTAELMGSRVKTLYDVGVAGIHRLLNHFSILDEADVLIVVAGMEGALASVVGGLVRKPVIAVPTSVGYGASFHGIAPLLTMLNSCAAGVAVVNIDNGFGAGYLAALINDLASPRRRGRSKQGGGKR